MEKIKKFFKTDKFAEYMGMELLEVSEGKAKARLKIKEHHLNCINTVHGGVIFALADLAFAAASNSHGNVAVGINMSISCLKAASGGTLTAEAKEICVSNKLASYTVNITNDNGDVIAVFLGMAYRKKDKIPD